MNERNMTVNISGKQINIAKDNATIRAIQNNRIEEKELDVAIKAIVDNLSTLNEENTYKILNILGQIKGEMDKENPKINHLKNCLKRIEQVINITNGIPALTVNLQKLYNIIKCTINL